MILKKRGGSLLTVDKYQIKHFLGEKKKITLKRYQRAIDILRVDEFFKKATTVVDFGCGPYGGIFTAKTFPVMLGVDPLWPNYERDFDAPDIIKIPSSIEGFTKHSIAHGIFCMDTLNYCSDVDVVAANTKRLLLPSGVFLLHVNLRTKKQIHNENERVFKEETVDRAFSNMTQVWKSILSRDPFNGKKYKTYLGAWRK